MSDLEEIQPEPEEVPAKPEASGAEESADPCDNPAPAAVAGADSAGGAEPDKPTKRRPVWLHLIILFFQILFLTPVYAGILAAAVGAGVGWHYFDESARLDIGLVGRPEIGALVRDAKGVEIGRAGSMNRVLIRREEIPPHVIDALIAAEDQRFFVHPGFDPVGSFRAALANLRSEAIKEGGSTLTQQLARDVYRLEGKNIDRKLSEIAAAVRIENRYSKDEILVHYLNRIYFGSGFYGLGAAARGYFGKTTAQLTADEAALICGVIPSPSRYSPFVNPERARENRDQTLRRMNEIGKLTDGELTVCLAKETRIANSREDSLKRGQIAYLISRTERELREELATWPEPPGSLDGFTVETSVDLAAQQGAAQAMDRHLGLLVKDAVEKDPLEAAFVLIENQTGRIVLSVGSRDYQRSEYDRAVEMKRPPGSAFLPFLYAAAFEDGPFTPATILLDAPFDNREMGLGAIGGVLGEWSTENPANRWEGGITAAEALTKSKNSPSARLGLKVGLDQVRRVARSCGIGTELRDMPGSLLGASEVSLTEMTRAYSVFANGGTPAPEPRLIREIRDGKGRIVARPAPHASAPALKGSTTSAILGTLSPSGAVPGARGKSGTTATFTDAWHFGFNKTHTWGVWIGRDRFTPIRPLAFGSGVATPLAESIVSGLLGNRKPVASSTAP
ncbi:MAG: transglycosylase domain-containing protein [Verrucomicrobia bacterium]|nr:transglycosylase domain-containing protein [Verrucomicrobiota bacterium]